MTTNPGLDCNVLVELVTDYLEGALPERERERFDEHLSTCDGCYTYLEQIRVTVRLTGTIAGDDLDPAMRDRLLVAFRDFHRQT